MKQVGLWLGLGAGIGAAVGAATHSVAVGAAIGIAIGLGLAVAFGRRRAARCAEPKKWVEDGSVAPNEDTMI